jgi:prepilin-type N-terminal cleavage/methylation domain-containing protein
MNTSRIFRAFTLIELLVVIAIIGILAAVVLSSLNSARTKSRDAAVQSDMDSLSPTAVNYEDTNHTFGDTAGASDCAAGVFSDSTFQNVFAHTASLNGGATATCYAADTAFAVAIQRPAGNGYTPASTYWCVDNSGKKCGINDASAISTASCGCP